MTSTEFKSLSKWEQVRTLSGVYTQEDAGDRLAIICLISRVELGDADQTFLDSVIDRTFGESQS